MSVIDAQAWTGRRDPEEDKLEADARRGQRAKSILEDDLVVHALATMREATREAFFTGKGADADDRERLWLMGQMVERFEEHFRSLIAEGKLAAGKVAALQEERKAPRGVKRFIG